MASLRRKPRSPFWFACFTDADGRRTQRSTKQSDRRKAQGVANLFEKAAKLGGEKRLGEAQARKVLSDIYEITNSEPLTSATARDYLTKWPERRKEGLAHGTYNAYKQACRDFIASLGSRADRDVSQLSRADVTKFRDHVAAKTTVSNANKLVKYLRIALGAAWKDGLTQDNPAAKVDRLQERDDDGKKERRAFTLPELKAVLRVAEGEWKSIILFGLYTATSLLKNAGVSEAVAMDIIGHDSKAISRHYTHIDDKAKRKALGKLPKLRLRGDLRL